MLRTPSFFGPLNSGFVPFASGAPVDARIAGDPGDIESPEAEATAVIARAAAAAVGDAVPHAVVAPWAPAGSAHLRIVEGSVLGAICAYFGWALLRVLGVF